MRQRSKTFAVSFSMAALLAIGAASLAAIATATSLARISASGSLEQQLAAISERSEDIAAFERNIQPVRLDSPQSRAVPFAGFLKSDSNLKPGRRITLARTSDNDAKLEILDVRRIAQSAHVIRPAALKMNLLLVKGRIIEPSESTGDRIVEGADLAMDEHIVHLLFAVGAASPAIKSPDLASPPAQHTL